MFADWFQGLFANDMAIDLGTATTLIYVKVEASVNEPSVGDPERPSRRPPRSRSRKRSEGNARQDARVD